MAQTTELRDAEVGMVDDLTAPTILVDGFSGVIAAGGVAVIGCTQAMLMVSSDQVMTPKKKVVLRLALPFAALPGMAKLLQDQVDRLVEQGVLELGEGKAAQNAAPEV